MVAIDKSKKRMARRSTLKKVLAGLGCENQCDNFIKVMLDQLVDTAGSNFRNAIKVVGPVLSRTEIATLRQHKDILDPAVWLEAIGDPDGEQIAVVVGGQDVWNRFVIVVSTPDGSNDDPG